MFWGKINYKSSRLGQPSPYKQVLSIISTILPDRNSMTGCRKRLAHDTIGNEDPSFRVKTLGQTQQAHPCAFSNFWVRRQACTGCRSSRDRPLKTPRCRACAKFERQVACAGLLSKRSARLTAQPASATKAQPLHCKLSRRAARTAQRPAMTAMFHGAACLLDSLVPGQHFADGCSSASPQKVGTSTTHHANLMSPPRDIWGTQLPQARHDQVPQDTVRGLTSVCSIKNANLRGAVCQEMNAAVMLLNLDACWTSPWKSLFGITSPHTSKAHLVIARRPPDLLSQPLTTPCTPCTLDWPCCLRNIVNTQSCLTEHHDLMPRPQRYVMLKFSVRVREPKRTPSRARGMRQLHQHLRLAQFLCTFWQAGPVPCLFDQSSCQSKLRAHMLRL